MYNSTLKFVENKKLSKILVKEKNRGNGNYDIVVSLNFKIDNSPLKLTRIANAISKKIGLSSEAIKMKIINFKNSLQDWEKKTSLLNFSKLAAILSKEKSLWVDRSTISESTYVLCRCEALCDFKVKISDHDKSWNREETLQATGLQKLEYEFKVYNNESKHSENVPIMLLKKTFSVEKAFEETIKFFEKHFKGSVVYEK